LLTLLPFDWQEIQPYTEPSRVDSLILSGFYPRLHHMDIHPTQALGDCFENMVIAEMFKYCYHHGRRPRLSFYRDSTGNEVDLLVERGQELAAVEIKSG
jgi:predicted AAA+ superfamily ATPase